MPYTFCLDFGNTRKKCGIFKGEALQEVVVLQDDYSLELLVQKYQPLKSILSSVINHNKEVEEILKSCGNLHILNYQSVMPFTTPVSKPETIGADRLAVSAAAVSIYPGCNNLVIALGTCITYNFINIHSEFLGGSISPGMEMRFRAMHEQTAKLPLIEKDWNFPLIGYDTRTNILSGVLLGMAREIDGIIDEYKQKYTNFNVLLTGGDAPYFVLHLKNKIFADPDLIFRGLFKISEHNYV